MTGSRGTYHTAWARRWPARGFRELLYVGLLGPLITALGTPRILGREHLQGLTPPVVFAANHSSHLDTPTILYGLPIRWQRRTVVVAAADYFYRDPFRAAAVHSPSGPFRSSGIT